MDGLVRVNGEMAEDLSPSNPPAFSQHPPQETKDVSSKQTEEEVPPEPTTTNQETAEQSPPPQTEKSRTSSGSAISSLIEGRNCIIKTTIVTELTQTYVEPYYTDTQSNGQVRPLWKGYQCFQGGFVWTVLINFPCKCLCLDTWDMRGSCWFITLMSCVSGKLN